MILKVTPLSISLANPESVPGPADGFYYVRVKGVPEGVSLGQVILLFNYTAKKIAEKERRYEFGFAELCPAAMLFKY